MPSRSLTGMSGRCDRCHVKLAHCVCAAVPEVPSRLPIVVIRHVREAWRSTGTARIAGLALPALRFVEYGDAAEPARTELPGIMLPGAALLYPGEDGGAAWESPPQQLIVLDGTWRESRRIFSRLTALRALPRLSLPAETRDLLRLRAPTFEGGRSTLEAIADALGRFEGPAVSEPLHALHARYIEATLRARGEWDRKQRQRDAGRGDHLTQK